MRARQRLLHLLQHLRLAADVIRLLLVLLTQLADLSVQALYDVIALCQLQGANTSSVECRAMGQ